MCCFTGAVKKVSQTQIFAREGEGNAQFVVYQMSLSARKEVAMVLPIPVQKGQGEKAVTFINLKEYSEFFSDLDIGFPEPWTGRARLGMTSLSDQPKKLEVYTVGDYDASYVPTINDFSRLDARFRLPPETWQKLPLYKDYGFAVFKLKSGDKRYHPMAFSFPRANPAAVFFPTVHIHDGKVHETADFDHSLYCQPAGKALNFENWEESRGHTGQFANINKAKGIFLSDRHCYRLKIKGNRANKDTWLHVDV
jgi:hypothetical protein